MDKVELLDIVAPLAPPPAPPLYGWIALGIGVLILLIGSFLFLMWRRRRAQRAALAQLKRTAHALRYQRIDTRTAAFQTGAAVRRLLLSSRSQASADWADFSQALDRARYARQMPGAIKSRSVTERSSCQSKATRAFDATRSRYLCIPSLWN